MNSSGEQSLLKTVFDALPSFVFVVDGDVRIQEYNAAASGLLGAERTTVLERRAGDALHCLSAQQSPHGCGSAPACTGCVVRTSVTEALQGNRVVRRRTKLRLERGGAEVVFYALISAAPFTFQERPLVLLVIEDISDIAELQRLLPICSVCKKIRDDQEAWLQVESYFRSHWDIEFTHSLCPACLAVEQEKMAAFLRAKRP